MVTRERSSDVCCRMLPEFLDSVLVIYKDLLAGKSPNTVIVPTSGCEEPPPPVAKMENDIDRQHEEAESSVLAVCIDDLCERFKLR